MLYNTIDAGLKYASYVKRAKFLVDLFDARCPQERAYILSQQLRDEGLMFVLRKVVLPGLRSV